MTKYYIFIICQTDAIYFYRAILIAESQLKVTFLVIVIPLIHICQDNIDAKETRNTQKHLLKKTFPITRKLGKEIVIKSLISLIVKAITSVHWIDVIKKIVSLIL